jgi:hypothetical protein
MASWCIFYLSCDDHVCPLGYRTVVSVVVPNNFTVLLLFHANADTGPYVGHDILTLRYPS